MKANQACVLLIIFSLLLQGRLLMAKLPHSTTSMHREHGAHVHGEAKLAIAFDQAKGQIEFKAAAESILGFEHAAKSENDKLKLAETKKKFESTMSEMIRFEEALNCQILPLRVDQFFAAEHSNHSDFVASYQVQCSKSPKGSALKIDFSSFSALKDLDVTVLIDELQKTAEAKGSPIRIELKP